MSKKNSPARSPGVMGNVYDDAAKWGTFVIGFETVGTLILAFILFLYGVYLVTKKGVITAKTSATVTDEDVNCVEKARNGKVINRFNCGSVAVEYKIGDDTYTEVVQITDSSKELETGDEVTIYYDPNNPSSISVIKDDPAALGKILIGVAVFLTAITLLYVWLSRRYKFIRAMASFGTLFGW